MGHKALLSRDYLAMKWRFSAVGCEFFPAGREKWRLLCGRAAADVAAAEAFGPVDLVDRSICPVAGGGEVGAEGGDPQHAAAIGEDPFPPSLRRGRLAAGPGVKDLDLGVAA